MAAFERKYIAEYCLAKWPEGGYQLGVALGPVPEQLVKDMGYEGAAALYAGWRPEVDAVHYSDFGLILIESKVFRVLDALAKLRWYGELVKSTMELRPWAGKDVQLRLVTPRLTDVVRDLAAISGVVVDVWFTPEVVAHAAKYEYYWTREAALARQEYKAKLKELGLAPPTIVRE